MSTWVWDHWWAPSPASVAYAKSKGCQAIFGYISNGRDSIYRGWSDGDFATVRDGGLLTGAYCSGWADPAWVKAEAARLNLRALLDCESSIRPDGPWVDPWLEISGTGFYGLGADIATHSTHGHPSYVLAGYPSNSGTANPIDPGLSWGSVGLPSPSRPIGRQYAGGVPTPFGPVDYSHFDPAFFAAATPQPEIPMAGGAFRPGTHEYHWAVVNPDKSVSHWYNKDQGNLSLGGGHDDLGGVAGGPVTALTWSDDGALCVLDVVGSDGTTIARNVWQGGKWTGWSSSNTKTLQIGIQGPPGPAGPPGAIPATATGTVVVNLH